ncbi:hypothetical protein PACID_24240 [Acidipropionibacterium acidipropionici ATCC 4875]|uniref:Winged helix DNA-binding domain-containing protein n=1 Tax=Acidipropionibacterium acidipropionici (strain ATCC 4875 / DSM 20272 / JCM 6432 / NBRC 12425 / NCIMB 8070 / 4) TaxID=1171373 RepID=K7SLT4_ACIA4|nr:winged helix DNA-binding domain-containing protein [Acidipropionibacterium acidipropionici]AFV90200.1 hypothetical protein PACID_24240 [Acidipropionibacterium acidipropionici ATCC 4875]
MAVDLSDPTTRSLIRMAGLGLAPGWSPDQGPQTLSAASPAEALAATVSRIGALQSQHWRGALHTLAMRTPDHSLPTVREAFDRGLLVRTWPMRGTLHTVAAADLPWLLRATLPRMDRQTAKRRLEFNIVEPVLQAAAETTHQALLDRPLTRNQLVAVWREEGLIGKMPGRAYHIFMTLCYRGILALGPTDDGGEQLVVELDLPKLMTDPYPVYIQRYFLSHGPATIEDLARWSGLTKSSLRSDTSKARTRGILASTPSGTQQLWHRPDLDDIGEDVLDGLRQMILLSGFDELIVGYGDRSCTLSPDHEGLICPGGNGMFKHTIVENGHVVGTWRREDTGDPVPEWFASPTRAQLRAFDRAGAQLPS